MIMTRFPLCRLIINGLVVSHRCSSLASLLTAARQGAKKKPFRVRCVEACGPEEKLTWHLGLKGVWLRRGSFAQSIVHYLPTALQRVHKWLCVIGKPLSAVTSVHRPIRVVET